MTAAPTELAQARARIAGLEKALEAKGKFGLLAFDFQFAQSKFEDRLTELISPPDYDEIGWDYYDSSLEIRGADNDVRLSADAQKFIAENGFVKVYVNHKDGWETHYSWDADFKPARGWRRKRTPEGNFLISYWPDGWTGKALEWKANGYMTVVPDQLEIKPDARAALAGEKREGAE